MLQKNAINGHNRNLLTKIKYSLLFPIVLISIVLAILLNLYQLIVELGYPIVDDQHEFDIIFILLDPTNLLILIIGISSYLILLVSIAALITLNDYKFYCERKRFQNFQKNNLSFDEIFKSKIRKEIIGAILKEPGIHYNDLLRRCKIHRGQLQWHLSVLVQFNIVKKEKFGQYSLFYPVHYEYQSLDAKNSLLKSKQSSKILDLIETNPGIYSRKIASRLNLKRNSVKYHVDKLLNKNLIVVKKEGRRKYLFPKQAIS
ncbi:MAG: winged helix-turn-helix transcriptional regulator [Candidatus Hodarchaeota archaeon]